MRRTRKVKIHRLHSFSRGLLGRCLPNGFIELDPRQEPLEFLDTFIHEMLHRELPDLSEEAVERSASRMAWDLWKHGYRKADL